MKRSQLSKAKRAVIFIPLTLIVSFFVVILWGKQLVTLLDNVVLSKPETIPLDIGNSHILFHELMLGSDYFPSLENVRIDDGRAVVKEAGREITLGSAVHSKNEPHTFDFYIDEGDQVLFSYQHSVLPWLTPFEMNFMTGHSPNKKRNVYYLLTWKKRDGSVLRARWEFEQWKYKDSDWGDWKSRYRSDGQTGLLEILIEKK